MGVCKNCTERYPACWGTCEKYIEERKAFDERKREMARETKLDRAIGSVQYTGLRKMRQDEQRRKKQGRK